MTAIYAAMRRGKCKPGMAAEFAKRVRAGELPIMKKMDGFKAYYLIEGADNTVIGMTLFTDKAAAEEANRRLMPWIKENLGPLLATPTEAIEGEVAISAFA